MKMKAKHTKELIEIVEHIQNRFYQFQEKNTDGVHSKKLKKIYVQLQKVISKNDEICEVLNKLKDDRLHPAIYIATVEWLKYCAEFYTKLLKKTLKEGKK